MISTATRVSKDLIPWKSSYANVFLKYIQCRNYRMIQVEIFLSMIGRIVCAINPDLIRLDENENSIAL